MLIIKNLNLYKPNHPKQPLIQNLNLTLDSKANQKIALLGANGSGKTTFLNTLLNPTPEQASNINKSSEIIKHLPQKISLPPNLLVGEFLENQLEFAYEFYKIEQFLNDLNLPEEILIQPTETLSGGEQVKIKLISILLQEPTILILDEPTNHLDQQSKDDLSNFIKNFAGTILFTSHDRQFLQHTVTNIWEIDETSKQIYTYKTSFNQWSQLRKNRIDQNNNSYHKLKQEIDVLQSWLNQNISHPKYRFSAIVTTKQQKLAKLQKQFQQVNLIKDSHIQLNKSTGQVSQFKNQLLFKLSFQNDPLFKDLNFKLYQGDKIHLSGPNGSGKTTLLKLISSLQSNPNLNLIFNKENLNIGYMSQESKLPQDKTIAELIQSVTDHQKAFQLLAQFKLKDKLKQNISTLSGGEQKRLQLAILYSQNYDLVLLDEPTNHLDIFLQEDITNYINSLNTAFILISHDKYLTNSVNFNKNIKLNNVN